MVKRLFEKQVNFIDAENKIVKLDISVYQSEETTRNYETLESVENPIIFTISGKCGNSYGQVASHIVPTKAQKKLIDFWEKYHRNDSSAGTKSQMEMLKENNINGYEKQCEFLESKGLLEDRGYKYGHGFLYKPFNNSNLELLKEIIDEIEREEEKREKQYNKKETIIDLDEVEDEEISSQFDCEENEIERVKAFFKVKGISKINEIDIKAFKINETYVTFYGEDYRVMSDDEKFEEAKSLATEEWIRAVGNHETEDGLDDWFNSFNDYEISQIIGGETIGSAFGYDVIQVE